MWICQLPNHSGLTDREILPKRTPQEMPFQTISYCLASLQGARTTTAIEETRGYYHLSPHHHLQTAGLESDRSLVLMTSSMLSLSDRSEGSQYHQWGRWCGETRAHMKINLPIFKDEEAKDAVTYQSWRWDLTVYGCAGCRDHTLLLYAIHSLQC